MKTVVARQPILDRSKQVVGYELLYRASNDSTSYEGLDGNAATAKVISDTVFSLGLEKLVGAKLAFINFTGDALVNGYAKFLPPDSVVLEVLEDTDPNSDVIAACRELKSSGYKLALDDFVDQQRFSALMEFADFVKIDVKQSGIRSPDQLIKGFRSLTAKALAEKVETWEEFDQARELGYGLFQGYFFARPANVTGRLAPSLKRHHLELLEAIQVEDLDYKRIEQIIGHDVVLTYKLFRYINSARFGFRNPIDSITQSLMLLGTEEVRSWATLVLLCDLGQGKPHELLVLALMRARFCELLGVKLGIPEKAPSLFLTGMFSLLDALLDRPLEDALREIPLDNQVADALLGRTGADTRFASINTLVRQYENGEWSEVLKQAASLGLSEAQLVEGYTASVLYAENTLSYHPPS